MNKKDLKVFEQIKGKSEKKVKSDYVFSNVYFGMIGQHNDPFIVYEKPKILQKKGSESMDAQSDNDKSQLLKSTRSFTKIKQEEQIRLIQFIDLSKKKMQDRKIKIFKDPSQYQEELEE